MGDKRFSKVVRWKEHIEPYRIIQFVAGVGSGKNTWVEKELMPKMRVLLVTSRKAKVNETKSRLGIDNRLNLWHLDRECLERYLTGDYRFANCICNSWQIEHYMKNVFVKEDPKTYIWSYFDVVVIDEVHSLATDATYANAPFYLYEFIKATYRYSNLKTLLMTGTFEPIDGLIRLKKTEDYKFWDFREECINIEPELINLYEQEHILSIIALNYRIMQNKKWHAVYFATKTKTIENVIVPFLVDNGVSEEHIAVSFSQEDEEGRFSKTIIENKERAEVCLREKEDLPEDIKVFITTSRNKEGINIDNDKCSWDIIVESHWVDEIRQMFGRVRSPISQAVVVTDAKQHVSVFTEDEFDYLFVKAWKEHINTTFDLWCVLNDLPLKNRLHDEKTRKRISIMESRSFPYLRYSPCEEKFVFYRGKIAGEESFAKSVEYLRRFFAEQYGEINAGGLENPFKIPLRKFKPFTKEQKFESYIKDKGFENEKPINREEQAELLRYVSDVLRIRPKANPQNRYKNLNDALKLLGYEAVECAKDKKKPLYGYRKLRRIKYAVIDDEGDI